MGSTRTEGLHEALIALHYNVHCNHFGAGDGASEADWRAEAAALESKFGMRGTVGMRVSCPSSAKYSQLCVTGQKTWHADIDMPTCHVVPAPVYSPRSRTLGHNIARFARHKTPNNLVSCVMRPQRRGRDACDHGPAEKCCHVEEGSICKGNPTFHAANLISHNVAS